jgi:hypothetical protein
MRLLVTHLTRMTHPRICVAGIDLGSGEHVRPVRTADDPLTLADTRERGGIFELGGIVGLTGCSPCGVPPEIEDHAYEPTRSSFERLASGAEVWTALDAVAQPDLATIFGSGLLERGLTYASSTGTGAASLGCLRVSAPLDLYVGRSHGQPRLRLAITLEGRDRDLAVTDLRLFRPDFSAPDTTAVAALNDRLRRSEQIILAVGLTRPFQGSGDTEPRHWLQANTIFCR